MSTRRFDRRASSVLLVAVALALVWWGPAACSTGEPIDADAPPAAPAEGHSVFVALGGDETLTRGLDDTFRKAWTRQVFATLPRSTVFVNLATEDATTRDGLDRQLPEALALEPTVATVWFGNGDAREDTDPDDFADELTAMVTQLRDAGADVILIANVGDERIPAFLPRIEEVATATGATYVEVPGPVGNPGDPAAQDPIAAAVTPALAP